MVPRPNNTIAPALSPQHKSVCTVFKATFSTCWANQLANTGVLATIKINNAIKIKPGPGLSILPFLIKIEAINNSKIEKPRGLKRIDKIPNTTDPTWLSGKNKATRIKTKTRINNKRLIKPLFLLPKISQALNIMAATSNRNKIRVRITNIGLDKSGRELMMF